jgi:hypothetical protein
LIGGKEKLKEITRELHYKTKPTLNEIFITGAIYNIRKRKAFRR